MCMLVTSGGLGSPSRVVLRHKGSEAVERLGLSEWSCRKTLTGTKEVRT